MLALSKIRSGRGYSVALVLMLAFETIIAMRAAAVLLLGVARRWRLTYRLCLRSLVWS